MCSGCATITQSSLRTPWPMPTASRYCTSWIRSASRERRLTELSDADSAQLLIGEARLSQRAYKYLRRSLRTKNVPLARWAIWVDFRSSKKCRCSFKTNYICVAGAFLHNFFMCCGHGRCYCTNCTCSIIERTFDWMLWIPMVLQVIFIYLFFFFFLLLFPWQLHFLNFFSIDWTECVLLFFC